MALSELEAARVRKAVGGFVASLNAAGHRRTFARSSISVFAFRAIAWNSSKSGRSGVALLARSKNSPSPRPPTSGREAGGEFSGSVGISSGTVISQRRKLRQSRSSLLWFTRTDMRVSLAEPTPNNRWRGP